MASAQGSRIKRTYKPFTGDITINPIIMATQEISNWKNAINAARSIFNPRRRMLMELFDNIKIDGHLESVMEQRAMGILNKRVMFEPKKGITIENDIINEKILETPWFYHLLELACEAVPFGYSAIELQPDKTGNHILSDVELINRANVIPEWGFIMKNANNFTEGIYYRDDDKRNALADPYYSPYIIFVGGKKDYGKLMTAAQYVIYKRGGFGDWSQFAELFGMPFRVGKYNAYDDASRKKLEDGLRLMGGAGYATIPHGTDLDFHDTNGTGKSEIFKDIVHECNSEISKIFVGQTMTTDNGSSHSQSVVHKTVAEEINLSDMIKMEYLLNWDFKPKIQAIAGISDLEKGKFRFPQTVVIPLDKRFIIDSQLCKIIDMTDEYFYTTYGVSKPGEGETIVKLADPATPPPAPEPDGDETDPKKKRLNNKDVKLYALKYAPEYKSCTRCGGHIITNKLSHSPDDLTPEEKALIDSIYNKEGIKYDYETFQQNISKLREGLMEGLTADALEYGTRDNIAATMMEININRFGFDKNIAQIYELNQALQESKSYSEFKKQAAQILGTYNQANLQTEYNFAIATAQNASAWNRQKSQQNDFPYLKYMTAGDDRVRPAHAALNGKLFKIADTSWRGIYPPNGWNCRCEMIQVNSNEITTGDIYTGEEAKQALGDEWSKMLKGGFAVNRGEINEVFDLNKAYVNKLPESTNKTFDNLSYKDAKLQSWKEMTGLNPIPKSNDVPADVFNKDAVKINDKLFLLFSDYNNRKLGLSEKVLNDHLTPQYVTDSEQRNILFNNLTDLFKYPDEVYFRKYKVNIYQYRYIQFFEDDMLVADVNVKNDMWQIQTWYKGKIEETRIRKGALIKNKKS